MDDQAKRDITHKQTPPKISSEYVIKSPREALTLAQQEKRLKAANSKSYDTTRLQTRTNKHQQPASFERKTNPIEGSAHDARMLRAGDNPNVSSHNTRANRGETRQRQQNQPTISTIPIEHEQQWEPPSSPTGSHLSEDEGSTGDYSPTHLPHISLS